MRDSIPWSADATDDDIWRRAKRAETKRMAIVGVSMTLFVFALSLVDSHHWPPRLREPFGDAVRDGALAAVVCLVVFGLVVYFQKIQAPERYVSPLRALDGNERRAAATAIDTARPSPDPRLRRVERLRALQLVVITPTSIGAALIGPVLLLLCAGVMFWFHTPTRAVMALVLGGLALRRGLLDHRRGISARAYLDQADAGPYAENRPYQP